MKTFTLRDILNNTLTVTFDQGLGHDHIRITGNVGGNVQSVTLTWHEALKLIQILKVEATND